MGLIRMRTIMMMICGEEEKKGRREAKRGAICFHTKSFMKSFFGFGVFQGFDLF